METGGKGKRKEMIREELHEMLCEGFECQWSIQNTEWPELLSQAYSLGNGVWMPFLDTSPYSRYWKCSKLYSARKNGGMNVIDLANINSCSFIATKICKNPNNSLKYWDVLIILIFEAVI
jgi:hypothetical protein